MDVHWFMWGFHAKSPFLWFLSQREDQKGSPRIFREKRLKGKDRLKQASISWRTYVSTLGYVSSGEIPLKKTFYTPEN